MVYKMVYTPFTGNPGAGPHLSRELSVAVPRHRRGHPFPLWHTPPKRNLTAFFMHSHEIGRAELRPRRHCSFAYSALASFRMGMSGSASFQMLKKS